jgi:hypothetical protein
MITKKTESKGAREFRRWMEAQGHSLRGAAALVEIDPGRMHRLLNNAGTPSLWEAVRIEDASGIPPRDWLA